MRVHLLSIDRLNSTITKMSSSITLFILILVNYTEHPYFFFFKEPAAPRNLPSSPPRRSPDPHVLRPERLEHDDPALQPLRQVLEHADRHDDGARGPEANGKGRAAPVSCSPPQRDARAGRSEEHTSELQSPCNIVCRLLLEKKK